MFYSFTACIYSHKASMQIPVLLKRSFEMITNLCPDYKALRPTIHVCIKELMLLVIPSLLLKHPFFFFYYLLLMFIVGSWAIYCLFALMEIAFYGAGDVKCFH